MQPIPRFEIPDFAEEIAKEVLTRYPADVPALTVHMRLLADSEEIGDAGKIAKKVQALAADETSLYHKYADDVLQLVDEEYASDESERTPAAGQAK